MIGMLMPEIAVIVDSRTAPPTTIAECVKYALRAEYHLNKRKKGQPLQSEVLGATSTTTRTVKISETKAGLEEVRGCDAPTSQARSTPCLLVLNLLENLRN
ncbi:hypothetical protein TIFTF001_050169 [Ficus carica]|uniref:Uncharacterized protein n=1 Tax=Ficus carica TaxID=3494 RepID=A0AA87Z5F5_FICCA|nr:hypothetical protein TIFTF001_050166 [Ficus carica]GMN21920.1 hypothetical protein TIFTF001_050169 [Ficus carica]